MAISVLPPVIKDLGNILGRVIGHRVELGKVLVTRKVLNLDEYEFGKKASGTGTVLYLNLKPLNSQTGEHPLCYEPVDRLCLGANSWLVATSIPRHNLLSHYDQ